MFNELDTRGPKLRRGSIEVVCGSMFSGKTEELIRRMKRAQFAKLKVEIFKPALDVRYSVEEVVSHDRNAIPSTPVDSSQNILLLASDVDVVGSNSLLNEVELMQIVDEVYRRLGINVCIKINNRKILTGIAEMIGEADKIVDITVAIDKLDKIGLAKVNEELAAKGISAEAIAKLQPVILLKGSNEEKLQTIKAVLASSEIGLKGVAEIEEILEFISLLGVKTEVELDLTLARGLNYYTGAIFEVKAKDVQIGSITGGGRYDNLTGVFGVDGLSGVGISFGADRIYDVLNQLELYPSDLMQATKVLFAVFGSEELKFAIECAKEMRAAGIPVEVYPEPVKMKKQMSYADAKNIPFVAIIGETEMAEKKVMLKNMESGNQTLCSVQEVIQMVK